MSRILAAGLTPAWQQTLVFDRLRLGEVNRAREAHWCASGKVVNVGLALAHLGAPARMMTVIGGMPGEAIRRDAESLSVSGRWIESRVASRVCTTILDRGAACTTELVENASPLPVEDQRAYLEAFQSEVASAEILVLSGSLPPEVSTGWYRDLIDLAPAGCRTLLDARGAELNAALERQPFLVKPNVEELGRTVGRELNSDAEIWSAMRELNDRGATWVVVSQGSAAVRVCGPERAVFVPVSAEVVNPIGCGDCLAAGIAWALNAGADVFNAVKIGMACAADNLSQLLPARLNPERVRQLAATIEVRPA